MLLRSRLLFISASAVALRVPMVGPFRSISVKAAGVPSAYNFRSPILNDFRSPIRGLSASAAGSLEEQIKSTVAGSKVVVYSKSWCPFCLKTKQLFESMGVEATVVELDEVADGDAIQATLLDITGQRTVPNVFIAGAHLGGNDDTQKAAASGKLKEMLEK